MTMICTFDGAQRSSKALAGGEGAESHVAVRSSGVAGDMAGARHSVRGSKLQQSGGKQ